MADSVYFTARAVFFTSKIIKRLILVGLGQSLHQISARIHIVCMFSGPVYVIYVPPCIFFYRKGFPTSKHRSTCKWLGHDHCLLHPFLLQCMPRFSLQLHATPTLVTCPDTPLLGARMDAPTGPRPLCKGMEGQSQYGAVAVHAFVVGSLESWDPDNSDTRRAFQIGQNYSNLFRKLCAIEGSHAYVST